LNLLSQRPQEADNGQNCGWQGSAANLEMQEKPGGGPSGERPDQVVPGVATLGSDPDRSPAG